MLSQTVLRPFAYLRIEHHSKWLVDWALPFSLATIVTLISGLGDHYTGDLLSWGFLKNDISNLVSILPGFYIAALSAIVVFNRNDIDKHMPDPTPVMKDPLGGIISLTRRRFLALTFSFLTAESILLLVLIGLGPSLNAISFNLLSEDLYFLSKYTFIYILFLIFSQLVTVTFLCLYYLGERLHQPDP
jgi:hypothetical protein